MRRVMMAVLLAPVGAFPASAMTRPATALPGSGARAAVADPGERLDRLAAAAMRGDRSHARPERSVRSILKGDPYLRAAYASLDDR